MEQRWNNTRVKPKDLEKTCLSPTLTDLGMNLGLCSKMPMTNFCTMAWPKKIPVFKVQDSHTTVIYEYARFKMNQQVIHDKNEVPNKICVINKIHAEL